MEDNELKANKLKVLKEIRAKLIGEQRELSLKVEELHTFLYYTGSECLNQEERDLMVEQYVYMKHYLRILNKRIAMFNEKIKYYK